MAIEPRLHVTASGPVFAPVFMLQPKGCRLDNAFLDDTNLFVIGNYNMILY